MKKKFILITSIFFLASCASPEIIKTVQVSDNDLSCNQLIAATEEEYEKLAIELATHPEKLKNIKDKLVSNLPIAPLYDTPMFTRHLESAYSMMYERYQRGLNPDHIYVKHKKQ